MAETKVLPCTCANEFQDTEYGKGQRVHNEAKSNNALVKAWRCSVCSNKKG